MEKLLPYFQEELATFRRDCMELAARYPRMAEKLGIAEDACGDPGVERIIQASALLSARVAKKLDDDYPRFIEALLQTVYPHYLNTFPSCSIIHIDYKSQGASRLHVIPRGTELHSRPLNGVRCRFTTSAEVVLSPVRVASARFNPIIGAPPGLHLDTAYDAALAIHIASPVPLKELEMKRLTLFIDGEPSLCAAVRDTLFLRTGPAFIQASDAGPWHPLPAFPVQPAGFNDNEALLPWPPRSHPAYRLLTEYFAFPDKFNFIEMDLSAILAAAPMTVADFTLHLPVRRVARDSAVARTLASFAGNHLRTHCAPVINLFARSAAPVTLHRRATEYPLVIDAARPAAHELYSINSARLVSGTGADQRITELRPFYGPVHGQGTVEASHGGYWITHRDELAAQSAPGHEIRIAIVGDDMDPLQPTAQTLSVDITCSNRSLPLSLPYGTAAGDVQADGILEHSPIRFLRKPTSPRRFASDQRAHWRLVSHLALNQRALSDIGLVDLRKMLNLYDLPHSPITQRQIAGIVRLSRRTVHEWVRGRQRTALMSGLEIQVAVDESAFAGSGLHVLVQLLDRFFALYGEINVFTRLVVVSATTGEEILTCQPRSGMTLLT